jgi:hypothetical protein
MTRYSERELWYPTLDLLERSAADGLTTSELIEQLTANLYPDGHDAEILPNRSDTHFSQTVRNLTGSHRALERQGFIAYPGPRQRVKITEAGRRFLAEGRRTGAWPGFAGSPTSEAAVREAMWGGLLADGGSRSVSPDLLNRHRIYRGARGIWVDTEETARRDPDGMAVTVSVLHTGRTYPDDLSDTGLVYHYPATERPGRDAAEIAATKRAAELQLPVFVITTATDPALRDVRRAYVVSYDDDAATFLLTFSDEPLAVAPRPRRRRSTGFAGYRRANETPATSPREPFSVDPNEVDRALGAHGATQNALADWLEANDLTPLSPPGGGADFDLAWERDGRLYVAEVKSINDRNEARQLRLGLGQVLHYQALLEEDGRQVQAVLVAERAPHEKRWISLCRRHGVALVWPGSFDELLAATEDESIAPAGVDG